MKERKSFVVERRKIHQPHSTINNRSIILNAHRHLLLSVTRFSVEYGWKCNESKVSALESILLGGQRKS